MNTTSLNGLQAQVRMLWLAILVLAALVMAGMAIGSPTEITPQQTIRAQAIQLVDDSGTVRAELGLRDGAAGLFLADASGRPRAQLAHASDGTGLYILDDIGTTRIGVVQFAHGGGGVALHGPDSKGAVVLYLKEEGSLRIFDADGNAVGAVRAAAPAD